MPPTQPTMWLMVGLPGSGKTTWHTRFQPTHPRWITVIAPDDIIAKAAKGAGLDYRTMFDLINHKAMRSLLAQEADHAARHGRDMVIDRTNLTRITRRVFIEIANEYGYRKIAVLCERPEAEILQTNLDRRGEGRMVPNQAMSDMMKIFTKPQKSEGFDKIIKAEALVPA